MLTKHLHLWVKADLILISSSNVFHTLYENKSIFFSLNIDKLLKSRTLKEGSSPCPNYRSTSGQWMNFSYFFPQCGDTSIQMLYPCKCVFLCCIHLPTCGLNNKQTIQKQKNKKTPHNWKAVLYHWASLKQNDSPSFLSHRHLGLLFCSNPNCGSNSR